MPNTDDERKRVVEATFYSTFGDLDTLAQKLANSALLTEAAYMKRLSDTLAEIRSGDFLLVDALEPGDVILSLENEKTSKKIKKAAGGKYSHAALVIDRLAIVESTWDSERDYDGVRIRPLEMIFVGEIGAKSHLMLPIRNMRRYDVYRYVPKNDKEKFADFKQHIWKYVRPYIGEPYASAGVLVEALRQGFSIEAVRGGGLRPLLHVLSRFGFGRATLRWLLSNFLFRHIRKGMFCSQLVSRIFRDGGFPIFGGELVMPRDLMKPLQLITEKVVVPGYKVNSIHASWSDMRRIQDVQCTIEKSAQGIGETWAMARVIMLKEIHKTLELVGVKLQEMPRSKERAELIREYEEAVSEVCKAIKSIKSELSV